MEYLIGLDIGTSSVKGVLMKPDGQIVHTAREGFVYTRLDNGGVEIGAEEYLESCFRALKTLAQAAEGGTIKGICASSASGNLVLLDQKGEAMHPIISWQDKRVTDEARTLLPDLNKDLFYEQIGWPYGFRAFPLSQLCYMKTHTPQQIEKCGMVCMSTEYLYYMLTGNWGISTSAGTTFFLIDQKKGRYIPELLELLEISEEKLPPVFPCGHVLGYIREEMEEICGIPAGTPVVLGSFDHPSAARGAGILKEGEMLLSCGTSWVVYFPIAEREKGIRAGMLIDPFLSPDGCYGAMSSVTSLSERLKLYVNRYIADSASAFSELSELARKSESGAGGLQIDPLDEPDDRKILAFPKEHIARAIMEGTVGLLKKRLDGLKEYGISADSAVMVGGPSEDPYWIALIEELCGITVRVEHGAFAGAVGAAVIAGVGTGVYEREEQFVTLMNRKEEAQSE